MKVQNTIKKMEIDKERTWIVSLKFVIQNCDCNLYHTICFCCYRDKHTITIIKSHSQVFYYSIVTLMTLFSLALWQKDHPFY